MNYDKKYTSRVQIFNYRAYRYRRFRRLESQFKYRNSGIMHNVKALEKVSTRPMSLVEAVMWGTAKTVKNILDQRELKLDENWSDYALLTTALKRKRKEVTKILLTKGCRVKKIPRTDNIDTPLHYAVKMNDVELVKLLLDKGASIDYIDQNSESPLCLAMKKEYHEIVDLILNDSNANSINTANKDDFSHFHIACIRNNVEVATSFIKSGVDINRSVSFEAKENSGCTPLHFAVNYGCHDIIQLLLQCKADVSIKNAENMTPLHLAVQKKDDQIVNLILSSPGSCNVNHIDNHKLSHFHIACMKNHMYAVEQFLLHGVDINSPVNSSSPFWPGYTALHFAVKGLPTSTSQVSLVELLLHHKANVNTKDTQEQTPLHLACLQNDERIYHLLQDAALHLKTNKKENIENKVLDMVNNIEQIEVIKLLLKHKSNLNIKNILNETPLFYLYKFDRSKIMKSEQYSSEFLRNVIKILNEKRKVIIQIFLDSNADVDVRNENGQTILHMIADINREFDDDYKEEIAELILSKGADVNAKDKCGLTPLHIAAKNGHSKLIELFLKNKANINCSEHSSQSTPLHLSTFYQQVNAINVLLNNGADPTISKSNCMNVLHIMALINPEISEEPLFIESYEKLIETFVSRGCDINAQDINGRTPLHLACWEHNNAGTWALLQHFPDINIEDCGKETALSFPINSSERCRNIYSMLKDYVNMLRIAGLPISEKTNSRYTRLYGSESIEQDTFLLDCKTEIKKMYCTKINNNTTLHDILFKSSTEMEVYARNEAFESILNCEDFDANFEIFGDLLRSQYRKGLMKKNLFQGAKDSLESMIGFQLPDTCTDQILQYLDNMTLKNLIKANTVKIDEKEKEKDSSKNENSSLEKALAYCKNLFNKQMEMEIA